MSRMLDPSLVVKSRAQSVVIGSPRDSLLESGGPVRVIIADATGAVTQKNLESHCEQHTPNKLHKDLVALVSVPPVTCGSLYCLAIDTDVF